MAGCCALIFGVSGVGKTSACEAYVATHPDTLFISASALLKAARNSSAERLRTAASGAIVDNQALLGPALAAFRAGREERDVLVDAHGVIDNDHELVRIPSSAISELKPDRLILLEASPETVAARRANSERRRPVRDLAAIGREIAAERETVIAYAKTLRIGLVIAEAGRCFTLDALLDAPCPARSG